MDYKLHYEKLIERAKNRKLDCYKEVHHIIPRCLKGDDSKENLVELTAREHFIAHLLLIKIYPGSYGLIKAINMMCVSSDNQDRSMNRMYGWLREKFGEEMSRSQAGEKNSQFGTMWISNIKLKQSKKIPKDSNIPEGWIKGRNTWNKKIKKKRVIKSQEERLKEKLEKQAQCKVEILSLYKQFISGDYYSVRDFHRKENINYSIMTLSNYWRKYIPEYKNNSKEGKRYNKEVIKI